MRPLLLDQINILLNWIRERTIDNKILSYLTVAGVSEVTSHILKDKLVAIGQQNVSDEKKKHLALEVITQDVLKKLTSEQATELLTWFRAETAPNKSLAYIRKETGTMGFLRTYGNTGTYNAIEALLVARASVRALSL